MAELQYVYVLLQVCYSSTDNEFTKFVSLHETQKGAGERAHALALAQAEEARRFYGGKKELTVTFAPIKGHPECHRLSVTHPSGWDDIAYQIRRCEVQP